MEETIKSLQTLSDQLEVKIQNFHNLPAQNRQLWKLHFLNHIQVDINQLVRLYRRELKYREEQSQKG